MTQCLQASVFPSVNRKVILPFGHVLMTRGKRAVAQSVESLPGRHKAWGWKEGKKEGSREGGKEGRKERRREGRTEGRIEPALGEKSTVTING